MTNKAPIKIPDLVPAETLEIGGQKVTISGFKASDKVYEIAIKHIKNQGLEIQARLNKVLLIEEEIEGEKTLRRKNDNELTEEEKDLILGFMDEVEDLDYKLVYGDNEDLVNEDRMSGPMALLAQRGLKRFYYPNTTSSKLDEIEDIKITEGDTKLIANTMINLAKPPSGLEKSILDKKRQEEKAADKGK